jgi:hypothetical protein
MDEVCLNARHQTRTPILTRHTEAGRSLPLTRLSRLKSRPLNHAHSYTSRHSPR